MGNNSVKIDSHTIAAQSSASIGTVEVIRTANRRPHVTRVATGSRLSEAVELFEGDASYVNVVHLPREPPPPYEALKREVNHLQYNPTAPYESSSPTHREGHNIRYPNLQHLNETSHPINSVFENPTPSSHISHHYEQNCTARHLYPSISSKTYSNSSQVCSKTPITCSSQTSSSSKPAEEDNFKEKPSVVKGSEAINFLKSVDTKPKLPRNVKTLDTAYLLELSGKDGPFIIKEIKQNKSSFKDLFQKVIPHPLLLILMKVVKKICNSDHLDIKIEIFKVICCDNFFDTLGDYISDLPTHTQDMAREDRLFLVESVLPFFECILSLIPHIVSTKLRDLIIKTNLAIYGIEKYQKLEVNDDIKNRLKKVECIIEKHVKMEPSKDPCFSNQKWQNNSISNDNVAASNSGLKKEIVAPKTSKKRIFTGTKRREGNEFVHHKQEPFKQDRSLSRQRTMEQTTNYDPKIHFDALNCIKVRGVQKSLFFIDKSYDDQESVKNAEFLISFASHLTKQQYDAKQLVVLTTNEFDAQNLYAVKKSFKILENLTIKVMNENETLNASIKLISFSVNESQEGMQSVCNRNILHKAFLGATEGIYMIGNMTHLERLSSFWSLLKLYFQRDEAISSALALCCLTHEKVSLVNVPDDFKSYRNGGCFMPCNMTLSCGHQCVRRCHSDDLEHNNYMCRKPCTRKPDNCSRNHTCPKLCHIQCGLCSEYVIQSGLNMMCHQLSQLNTMQHSSIQQSLLHREAGAFSKPRNLSPHPVEEVKIQSYKNTPAQLPCGHISQKLPLSKYLDQWSVDLVDLCQVPCSTTLECGHPCPGTCGKCRQGKVHVPCHEKKKIRLACGHRTVVGCSVTVSDCKQKCFYECPHLKCRERCGVVCTPCKNPCASQCEHSKCHKKCSKLCNRQPCNKPCQKNLVCGHLCVGLCGEPCPPGPENCRVCNSEKFKRWDSSGKARFVLLENCKHVVRVNDLDKVLFKKSFKLEVLECPICGYSITNTSRYLNFNKELHRLLFMIRHYHSQYLSDLNNKFWKIIAEIKECCLPNEIENHHYVNKIKEILGTLSSREINEKSVVLLQFTRNILCSIGTAPYSTLLWMLDLLIERYENGFSSQVLKELCEMTEEYQKLNRNICKEKLLDLRLSISYFCLLEKDMWFKCHQGHVTTYNSLNSCSLCDKHEV